MFMQQDKMNTPSIYMHLLSNTPHTFFKENIYFARYWEQARGGAEGDEERESFFKK